MKTITIDILRVAFRKLLTATYYDKTDMVMRYRVATLTRNLSSEEEEKRIFDELLSVAEGKNEKLLDRWLHEMSLSFYPNSFTNPLTENSPIVKS